MDVDIVLNACLETYQQDEIQKIKMVRESEARQREGFVKKATSKLFKNGRPYADIEELTVSQSRPTIPIVDMRGRTRSYVGGKLDVTGTFSVELDNTRYREMSPAYDMGVVNNWTIETEQVFSDGSSYKIRIPHIILIETQTNNSTRVVYNFRGYKIEDVKGK